MTFDLEEYRRFIASKGAAASSAGFEPRDLPERLSGHRRNALEFACRTGRSACFLDTGLGKSGVQAVFADQARQQTNMPSLILTPLAVARQMQRECADYDVEARVVREDADVFSGVNIANYERLPKLDVSRFGAVCLDESSIMKSMTGRTKSDLIEAFAQTQFRIAATATPAPNDHVEIGGHSEFLGHLGTMEMLARWFINDASVASQTWRLKGHAAVHFWNWVASWARSASLPSDLGGCDDGFVLPELRYHVHQVDSKITEGAADDALFRMPDMSATAIHQEKRLTQAERVAKSADIANNTSGPVVVWCETNDESTALTKAIPDAIEVSGSMNVDQKEAALDAFTFGERRVIVTKPKLAGFGLNWQHAATVVFASVSHSYEQHYQAVRRVWRFGQSRPVDCHMVIASTELPIWRNVQRKMQSHDDMKSVMRVAMGNGVHVNGARKAYTRTHKMELPSWMESAQ